MNRSQQTEEYRFNEKNHRHELLADGKWTSLTGCTTVLGVIAKPMLIQWAANEAVNYVRDKILSVEPTDKGAGELLQNIPIWLEEARKAHAKKRDKAGDWGTTVHEAIENFIRTGIVPTLEDKGMEAFNHFHHWAHQNKVQFMESERCVYSKSLFTGGIVDLVCQIDGQTWIADIKTGSGIYAEAFWQMAGYQIMLNEMGLYPDITGYIVLNLKKDGTFEEKRSVSNEDNKQAFMSALSIYRIQEKINNQII